MSHKFEYKKSDLSINRWEKDEKESKIGKEGFTELYHGDVLTESLRQQIKTSTQDSFAERYSEIPITQEKLEEKVSETHSGIFKGKTLSGMSKGKRAKSAQEKIKLQKLLMEENKSLLQRREEDREYTEDVFSRDKIDVMMEYYGDKERDALREWLFVERENGSTGEMQMEVADGLFTRERFALNDYRHIMKKADELEPENFTYKSDAQFVSEYASKYSAICQGASIATLLPVYEKALGSSQNKLPVSRIRAKALMFQDLKEEYEDRMKLISSPYYALLAEKDIKSIPSDGSDPELAEFLRLADKLSKSAVGKGKSITKLYQERLSKSQQEQSQKDAVKIDNILEHVEFDKTKTGDAQMRDSLEKRKDVLKNSFKEKDEEFLTQDQQIVHGTILYSMDVPDLMLFDAKLAKVLTEGKLDNQDIAPEHMDQVKAAISKYCDARREYIATSKAASEIADLQEGYGTDMQNPEFMKTEAYKRLMGVYTGKASSELVDLLSEHKIKFFGELMGVFSELSDLGYYISEKYEERIITDYDDAVENIRKEYEKTYYTATGVPVENRTARLELPTVTFTVDGIDHDFMLPLSDELQDLMKGNKYEVNGEEGAELLRLITKYIKDSMDMDVLDTLYSGEGGEKGLVREVHKAKLTQSVKSYMDRLDELLIDRVRGYRYTVEHRGERSQMNLN